MMDCHDGWSSFDYTHGIMHGITHGIMHGIIHGLMHGFCKDSDRDSASGLYLGCIWDVSGVYLGCNGAARSRQEQPGAPRSIYD